MCSDYLHYLKLFTLYIYMMVWQWSTGSLSANLPSTGWGRDHRLLPRNLGGSFTYVFFVQQFLEDLGLCLTISWNSRFVSPDWSTNTFWSTVVGINQEFGTFSGPGSNNGPGSKSATRSQWSCAFLGKKILASLKWGVAAESHLRFFSTLTQWEFQDPKLEVPIIYRPLYAYVISID